MTSGSKRVVLAVAVSIVMIGSVDYLVAQRRMSFAITRLYSGPDGQAHAEKTDVNLRPSSLRAGLDESNAQKVAGAQFLRWPPGYVWEWHTATRKQYVITISGRGEVEVAGGQKFQFGPGAVILAEDVTGKGHTTRVLGSDDLVLLLIPFEAR